MRNESKEMVRWEEGAVNGQSFAGHVQTVSSKTATSAYCTTLVTYHVRIVLTNFTFLFLCWLIENGHTTVGYLLVQ